MLYERIHAHNTTREKKCSICCKIELKFIPFSKWFSHLNYKPISIHVFMFFEKLKLCVYIYQDVILILCMCMCYSRIYQNTNWVHKTKAFIGWWKFSKKKHDQLYFPFVSWNLNTYRRSLFFVIENHCSKIIDRTHLHKIRIYLSNARIA